MRKLKKNEKLIIASHNKGKVKEIKHLLQPYNIDVVGGYEFNFEEPDENGITFQENAKIKSLFFAKNTKTTSLSDDSGLIIPDLDGKPGIHSARWAGKDKNFSVAMNRIKKEIEERGIDINNVDAYFICIISVSWADLYTNQFEGKIHGKLTFPARGEKGFGYDPIFIPNGYDTTFAEMSSEEKHKISHRYEAMKLFMKVCL